MNIKSEHSFSRTDRVFMSRISLVKYQALKLWGMKCSVSDHVSLFVESEVKNWGPRPFRPLDIWLSHPGSQKWW